MKILPLLDFIFFPGLYFHGVQRHQSKKREVNPEELDVLFDQYLEEILASH